MKSQKKTFRIYKRKGRRKEEEEKLNIINENERSSNINNEKTNEREENLLKSIGEKGGII